MRVALGRLDGVVSVDVTLKRGVAHILLREDNRVTLAALRKTVKDAGYSSGVATVTVRGTVSDRAGRKVLSVTGTAETFDVQPGQGVALQPGSEGGVLEVYGKLAAPDGRAAPERLEVLKSAPVR